MEKIIEYIVNIDGEFHSAHIQLIDARKIYRSIINVAEVEGRKGTISLIKKEVSYKPLSEQEFNEESVFNGDQFADSVNL